MDRGSKENEDGRTSIEGSEYRKEKERRDR